VVEVCRLGGPLHPAAPESMSRGAAILLARYLWRDMPLPKAVELPSRGSRPVWPRDTLYPHDYVGAWRISVGSSLSDQAEAFWFIFVSSAEFTSLCELEPFLSVGVTRLISDESTAKTRLSYRDTPLLLTVPNDRRRRHRCGYRYEQPHF
jgi:hypothetical protein